MRHIVFLDTTLRDGEQTPGVHINRGGKLEISRVLEKLGVDIIEAGFPAASQGDFRCVEEISRNVRKPVICALARCVEDDVKSGGEEKVFTIVGAAEVDFFNGKISNDSPVGKALIGAKKGDIVEAVGPTGKTTEFEIIKISNK